jgi:hypothetical protein
MKVTDFRIGNLVRDKKTGVVMRVSDLTSEDGTIHNASDICGYVIDRLKFPLPDGWEIEPIPLTEKWLLRMGFVSSGHWQGNPSTYTIKDFTLVTESIQGPFYYDTTKTGAWFTGAKLQYVHQLQNLYFALTGQEIEIQPE